MKAIVKLDKRGTDDRAFDDMWNKMCKTAKLNYSQSMIVAQYLRDIMTRRIHEMKVTARVVLMPMGYGINMTVAVWNT